MLKIIIYFILKLRTIKIKSNNKDNTNLKEN